MSQKPFPIFTDRGDCYDVWMKQLMDANKKPLAITPCLANPFLVPYLSDYGSLSLFIGKYVSMCSLDVYELVEQAKADKFRAVYLLDGKQDVMLFRNKYCERLTPEYVMSAPIEELQSLAWAGKAENVGTLTMNKVEV